MSEYDIIDGRLVKKEDPISRDFDTEEDLTFDEPESDEPSG